MPHFGIFCGYFCDGQPQIEVDMLSPDIILEDIRYGEELEAKNEYYKAYWVYMYAESAVDREDEAMCLIGSREDFAEAESEAGYHRRRIWKYLTEEEKAYARLGKNPFCDSIDIQAPSKPIIPYDLGGYYIDYVNMDMKAEESGKSKTSTRKESLGGSIILLLYFILHPFRRFKWK